MSEPHTFPVLEADDFEIQADGVIYARVYDECDFPCMEDSEREAFDGQQRDLTLQLVKRFNAHCDLVKALQAAINDLEATYNALKQRGTKPVISIGQFGRLDRMRSVLAGAL